MAEKITLTDNQKQALTSLSSGIADVDGRTFAALARKGLVRETKKGKSLTSAGKKALAA